MLVKGWISDQVISVDEETSMMKAYVLMKENNIRRLPVVRKGKLVGIVTDTDLKEACPSTATTLDIYEINYLLSEIKVKESMSKDVVYVKPDETVEFAAILMLENKISGLPVVNDQQNLIGVITQTDIFKALIYISGVYKGNVQFALCLEDRPGSVKEVGDVIRSFGGRMVSILTSYDLADEGYRNVYIRIKPMEQEKLAQLVNILEKKFTVLYTAKESLEQIKDRSFPKT
ncbi:MAG: CBS and ACT domain-containing protein [Proteobacteria bacterium]|nr:CBS and ACT domain-containing protein [Pseudomonadota bacterium]MBU4288113.1 CBS and ACT domain-containing protein [Pseudomonadota bacterium]MBU4413926.1 CBS and ACT domain-containing protein [Pseudomonadota bacterium]MCG2757050.1 CBS and ACT domain-containing protein [Desulfobacteraceae bacterium]